MEILTAYCYIGLIVIPDSDNSIDFEEEDVPLSFFLTKENKQSAHPEM